MSLLRLNDFSAGTIIQSAQVDAEFNQLVEALNGVSGVEVLMKHNHAANPVLNLNQQGAGLIMRGQQAGVDRFTLSALGKLLLPAGIGATPSVDQISNFGSYLSSPNQVGTIANTTETDLNVTTVAANTLANIGDFILLLASINYANNANTKRVRLYFGATNFYDTGAIVATNLEQQLFCFMFRNGATTLLTCTMSTWNGTAPISLGSAFTVTPTFTANNTLKITGQNGTASAGDIVSRGFITMKGSV